MRSKKDKLNAAVLLSYYNANTIRLTRSYLREYKKRVYNYGNLTENSSSRISMFMFLSAISKFVN